MIYLLFVIFGLAAALNVYTYGVWLKKQGNAPGFLLTLFLATATFALPIYQLYNFLSP